MSLAKNTLAYQWQLKGVIVRLFSWFFASVALDKHVTSEKHTSLSMAIKKSLLHWFQGSLLSVALDKRKTL
jgi:hypothetical protein